MRRKNIVSSRLLLRCLFRKGGGKVENPPPLLLHYPAHDFPFFFNSCHACTAILPIKTSFLGCPQSCSRLQSPFSVIVFTNKDESGGTRAAIPEGLP